MQQPPPEMLSFGGSSSTTPSRTTTQMLGGGEHAEAASPISSRPPAAGSINFDELASSDHDHHRGGGGGSSGSGNRWPRQETLALLKIRSEMDVAFRDATLKGPLWDEVSRKLGELGYVRSAKKCKEKFENVHKYYKRTKEGRHHGKTYRFFTELEALQGQQPPPTDASNQLVMTTPFAASASVGNVQFATPVSVGGQQQPFTMYSSSGVPAGSAAPPLGISFSSDSASSGSDDDLEEIDDMMSEEEDVDRSNQAAAAAAGGSGQKRKRSSEGSWKAGKRSSSSRMMDFFEGLMKQVMQKQEAMQQKFLETIEKREQDRLMREDAWKQHEAARLSREQQLAAQERAMAASRDAAIVSFLQKITGQTIQLPPPPPQPLPIYTTMSTTAVHHVAVPPALPTPASAPVPLHARQQQIKPQTNTELMIRQQQQMPPPPVVPTSNINEVIMAVPERQIPPPQDGGGSSSSEPASSSSRWPKVEVLALIKLRSNLENRYQEAGPKGPLWEEISAGMQRMGYNRSSKRCKEKWENINKYFKKVKESNKKRPEDAKTCPYFNELDALYQRKKLGSSSSSTMVPIQQQQQQQGYLGVDQESSTPGPRTIVPGSVVKQASHAEPMAETADGSDDQVQPNSRGLPDDRGQGSNIAEPEDIMMDQQKHKDNQQKMDDESGDNSVEDDEDDDRERKIEYRIDQFQRSPSNNNKNGSGAASSFSITMVQ